MKKILSFQHMLTPILVQILFWLAIIISIVTGFVNLFHGHYRFALEAIILGPLAARVAAEVLLIWFKIYSVLLKIQRESRL